jgi:N-carbamoyl-L-amino-acid hydrolase
VADPSDLASRLRIDDRRFLRDLAELGRIGRVPEAEGGGLDRAPFSPAERAARDFFCERARASGLDVSTDGAGNLSARVPAAGDRAAETLLIGSHLDTVPNGGAYDGALGVVAALEVVRVIAEADLVLPLEAEAIAFTDEEGRYGGFFGSQAVVGGHTEATIGAFLEQAMTRPEDLEAMRPLIPGGLTPAGILSARREPETIFAFLELHIEQGPRLEQAGIPTGVVQGIFGRRSLEVTFAGRPDHAGTTPLRSRADALVAAAQFVVRARDDGQRGYPDAVVTCGNVVVRPGVQSVVPGEAKVMVEFRAATIETLASMEQWISNLADESATIAAGVTCSLRMTDERDPVAMDAAVQAAIERAAESLGIACMPISSGALHDATLLTTVAPTGMVFTPSTGGRSHCPEEHTDASDLVAGANVLLQTALDLLSGPADWEHAAARR